MEMKKIENKFLPIEIFDWNKYDNIIVQSQTGTGKTSNFIKSLKDTKYKIISITAKRSLASQHLENLRKEFDDLLISHYKQKNMVSSNHLIFCINSIMKLENLIYGEVNKFDEDSDVDKVEDFMKNRILFIDEITIFLLTELTRNETLDRTLKQVFVFFMKLVKYAKKIYMCQSKVNMDAVNVLLKCRSEKTIFYENTFEVNKDKIAIRYKSDDAFVQRLLLEQEGFLFGCDCKEIIDALFNKFAEKLDEEDKKKLFKITSETSMKDYRPREGDFVFYSPSIIYGVDFNFSKKQNQYIYIKNNSTIDASQCYQQAMRTRNVNQIHYFRKKR
jgi:hypothetical protein